jgi:hypothetical protein
MANTPEGAGSVVSAPVEVAITFGVQYAHEPHPVEPAVNPDGYWVIEAPTYDLARWAAFKRFGYHWAFDYLLRSDDFQRAAARWYTLGELGRTRVTAWTLSPTIGGTPDVTIEDIPPETVEED